ncbi:MAG TPA: O-antigen ligase family protein [Pyrinomonadaceae bacterium]|nr:O-antigen ligase family protein [Pyrinomonadaceae bacterium]
MLNKIAFSLVCITTIATTLAYGTVHQPIIAVFYLMTAMMAVLWAAGCTAGGHMRVSRSMLQVPLLLIGLYAVVQVIPLPGFGDRQTISVEPFATYLTAVHIFVLCLFFALALVSLDSARRLRRMSSLLVIFGFIYAFYAILQSVLSPERIYGVYDPASATPFGSFVNRHDFAALMNMVAAIPLGLIFAGAVPRDKRLLYVVSIALIGTAVLLSGSRGGLVALVAEILILLILTTRSKGRGALLVRGGLSFLLLIAAVGGAVFVGGDTSLTRFSDAASANNISSSRLEIWATTLKLISDHLPFGTGLGAYAQAYTRYDTLSGLERIEQAHNDYLQLAADAGIVGVLIGALFLFWFFREAARNCLGTNTFRRGIAIGAFAGCSAVLVHSVFDFVLHITAISVMFLMLLAMLVASGREFDDDIDEFDDPRRTRRRSASVTPIKETSRSQRAKSV